jgi:hypothetical protein|tara:strand:+ start:9506 stop:9676 length:171 start_codon:yes stop_codon:yes gene_type:complete
MDGARRGACDHAPTTSGGARDARRRRDARDARRARRATRATRCDSMRGARIDERDD